MSRGTPGEARRGPALRLADPLFRSRRVCRALYGLDPGPGQGSVDRLDHDAFDLATLALRRGLRAWLPPGVPIVEVGAGPSPALTAWLARRGHPVVAWEADPASAVRARIVLEHALGAQAPLVRGTFGPTSPVEGAWLVANPPYVPTARGRGLRLDPARPQAWDGGPDGLDGYRRLAAALRGRFHGVVVLGGNRLFHRPGAVVAAVGGRIEDCAGCGPGWAIRLRLGAPAVRGAQAG